MTEDREHGITIGPRVTIALISIISSALGFAGGNLAANSYGIDQHVKALEIRLDDFDRRLDSRLEELDRRLQQPAGSVDRPTNPKPRR